MEFLLTNDDGYNSKKLKYAKRILSKYGTVYTVAPAEEQSGKSMSLSIGGFRFEKIDEFNYIVYGTPVDCVNFAFGGLELRPDLTVSGINDGYNLGFDTRYSGTVGACLQVQYFGFPTVAFSSDRRGSAMMEKEFEKTLQYILDEKLYSKEFTLNVNFPREKFDKPKELLHTRIYHQTFAYHPEFKKDRYIPNREYIKGQDLPKGTDAYAYAHGHTSISKITIEP